MCSPTHVGHVLHGPCSRCAVSSLLIDTHTRGHSPDDVLCSLSGGWLAVLPQIYVAAGRQRRRKCIHLHFQHQPSGADAPAALHAPSHAYEAVAHKVVKYPEYHPYQGPKIPSKAIAVVEMMEVNLTDWVRLRPQMNPNCPKMFVQMIFRHSKRKMCKTCLPQQCSNVHSVVASKPSNDRR